MDGLWAMILLGQKPPESLWRMLAPVLTIIAIAVFGWLNEKAKQKQRQQEAQEQARSKDAQAESGQGGGQSRVSQQRRTAERARSVEQIHRYQPQIPTEAKRVGQRRVFAEPEKIVVAEDVSGEVEQSSFGGELRRLQAETIRRARARQQRQTSVQAKSAASVKAAEPVQKRSIEALPKQVATAGAGVSQVGGDLGGAGQGNSVEQIRRAVVWSEILGAPRALHPLEQVF